MPNWVRNTICIKGNENDVMAMINDGLANSNEKSFELDHFTEAVDHLVANGKSKRLSTEEGKITLKNGLTLRTFLPIPDTYLLYDTTNHPELYPDAVEEQKSKYGIVGWYDYNCETLGCKWDSDVEIFEFTHNKNSKTCYIQLFCDTPWSPPKEWIQTLIEKYHLEICLLTIDEGYMFCFYECINDGDGRDCLGDFEELWNNETIDDEDYGFKCEELEEKIEMEFYDFVHKKLF